jgi:hypothetical protein
MKVKRALMDIWLHLRIRRPTVQDDSELADTRTVEAHPPLRGRNNEYIHKGIGHCVLIHDTEQAEPVGIHGTHVH